MAAVKVETVDIVMALMLGFLLALHLLWMEQRGHPPASVDLLLLLESTILLTCRHVL